MKKKLRLAALYIRFNFSSALEYRASFLSAAVGMFISDATFIFFWWVVFDQTGGTIGGYDFRDMMFIWATSASAFGLMNIVFGNLPRINDTVMTGALDTYLLQPRNVLLNLLMSRTDFTAWGDLVYGVVLMILTDQGFSGWMGYLTGVFSGGIVMASEIVILQSTVFFLGNSSFLSNMSINLSVNFCTYPEGIFPRALRFLLYWLIPAQFIVHVPLRIARGVGVAYWLPTQILAALCFAAFAVWVFGRGLKRYESGNLIITRM
jgi:ABC-2 type transport system permease protein